jgi:thiol-disulfide isomerase/thioredoxin
MKSQTKKTLFFLVVITALAFLSFFASYTSEGFADGPAQLCMVYADWCGHCKTAKPIIEELKRNIGSEPKLAGKAVTVELVNGEENSPLLASLPKVGGYPTFFLKRGSSVDEYKGPRERAAIVDWLAGRL